MKKILLSIILILMAATLAIADTVYLRDGRVVHGTVLGFINGRFAVRVTSMTGQASTSASNTNTTGAQSTQTNPANGDIVFIRPRDIQRVEIEGRSLDEARYQTRAVEVALGPQWIDTGVDLRRGQRVQVTASGTIMAGRTRITPGGLRSTDPNAPLPRASEGVLIGAIGNDADSPIVEIGLSREFIADRDGRLYLTANRASYTDARGAYTAQVRTEMDFNAFGGNRTGDDRNRDNDNNAGADDFDPFGNANARSNPAPPRSRVPPTQDQNNTRNDRNTNRTTRETTINVPGNSRGTDTGIDVRNGDQLTLSATGSIVAGRRAGEVSPDGGRVGIGSVIGGYPVPNAGVGALIGYIRLSNGQITQPFVVGSQQTITAPVDGRLFLLINDDNYSDNSGSFSVKIVY